MKHLITLSVGLAATITSISQTFTNYTSADGLLADNVNCVDVDASNNIWFGTQNGVSVFDGVSLWTDHTNALDTGLVDDNIQAIYVASDGTVWAGTDFGLSYFNGTVWATYTELDGLGDDRVNSITEDASGNMWIGTADGASFFDGSSWTNFGMTEGLPFGGVNHIEVASTGDVYMGSGLGGMQIWDGSSFTEFVESDGLMNDKVRSLAIDGSGNKWVGTADGITVIGSTDLFVENHSIMYVLPPPDTLNPVEDVAIDANGNIWTAIYVDYLVTEGGIAMYNGSYWRDYDVADGLVGPVVKQMVFDGNNDLWITTSTGVSKMSNVPNSINEVSIAEIKLYPNPSNGSVHVIAKENSLINVYDIAGREVYKTITDADDHVLDVSNWRKGTYLVQIEGTTERLIVY